MERTRLAAYAWCETDDAVLLAQIAPGFADTGWWTLPGGGLDFGEDPVDCVLRELREETGLEGRIDELVGIVSYVLEPSETILGDRLHVVGMLYRVTPIAGELRDERNGTTDHADWIPFSSLDELPLVASSSGLGERRAADAVDCEARRRDNRSVTAAVFGLIGVVVGALINGVVVALSQRRTDRAERRVATRLVATELDTWYSLALEAEQRSAEQLPQLHKAEPILWQSNRSVLARSLGDDEWETVANAYAHVDALVSVLVFERDGTLEEWRSHEAKRLFEEMVYPVEQARGVLARASGDDEDERRPPRRRPVAA